MGRHLVYGFLMPDSRYRYKWLVEFLTETHQRSPDKSFDTDPLFRGPQFQQSQWARLAGVSSVISVRVEDRSVGIADFRKGGLESNVSTGQSAAILSLRKFLSSCHTSLNVS